MPPAWIRLQCPVCGDEWEADPTTLPAPEESFTCDDCGATQRTSEFMKTTRSLEVLEEFRA